MLKIQTLSVSLYRDQKTFLKPVDGLSTPGHKKMLSHNRRKFG